MTTTNAANKTSPPPSSTSAMNAEYLNGLLARKESIEALLSSVDGRLLIFGVLVLVGIAGESWYGYKTWRENKELRSVQKQIDAEQDRKSRAEADETKGEIAKANESAAMANERAERAKLETEQLKAKFAWRTLDLDKAQKLRTALAVSPGTVLIGSIINDGETSGYAAQISMQFRLAGWKVLFRSDMYNGTMYGTIIPDSSAPQLQLVRNAFMQSGLSLNVAYDRQMPKPVLSQGSDVPDGNIVFVMVGSKNTGL